MKKNMFPAASIMGLTAMLAFPGWKIYCFLIKKKFEADRKSLLKKLFVLKQNTDALIKKLHEFGVERNAFHKELLNSLKLTSCLNRLQKIRDEIVIDKVTQIKNVCSKADARNLLTQMDMQTMQNMEVENALEKSLR